MEYLGNMNEEMASRFITGTYELIPKSFPCVSDSMHGLYGSDEQTLPNYYSILCGSSAEFYIQPFYTCINDIDVLSCRLDGLSISGDLSLLPSDLSDLSDTIELHKIEPYDKYPGFVRLRCIGKLKFNWKCKKYEFNPIDHPDCYQYANMDALINAYYFP